MEHSNPFELFAEIFQQAANAGIPESNSVSLATASPDGRPSVRIVLLKGFDNSGFVFYTNLESRKGRELLANPHAALCFFWQPLGRQIRVEGAVEPVTPAEADAYFASRARGSQIGAWASAQSSELDSRQELLDRVAAIEERFKDADIPRPGHWSGFRLRPLRIEFWTAGEFRLHDRIVYERGTPDTPWQVHRLYP